MWYQKTNEGLAVSVVVIPGASRDEVVGIHGDALKVKVTAAPEKGKATERVRELLAEHFGVSVSAVVLQRGQSQRQKVFVIRGVTVPPTDKE